MKVAMTRSRPLEIAGASAVFNLQGEYCQKYGASRSILMTFKKYYPLYKSGRLPPTLRCWQSGQAFSKTLPLKWSHKFMFEVNHLILQIQLI
jgi:hypothetical protein